MEKITIALVILLSVLLITFIIFLVYERKNNTTFSDIFTLKWWFNYECINIPLYKAYSNTSSNVNECNKGTSYKDGRNAYNWFPLLFFLLVVLIVLIVSYFVISKLICSEENNFPYELQDPIASSSSTSSSNSNDNMAKLKMIFS